MTETPPEAQPPAAPPQPSAQPMPQAQPAPRPERLAERSPGPKVRRCVFCGAGRPPRHRRGDHLGIILERHGDLDIHVITEATVQARSGRYNVEGTGFYVARTIPRGSRLTFWPEGDPEPVTAREPKGYGAAFLERLVGGSISNAVLGSFASKHAPLGRAARIGLLVGGLLVAVAFGFLWLQRKHHGG